jgi:hypothetical protein
MTTLYHFRANPRSVLVDQAIAWLGTHVEVKADEICFHHSSHHESYY